MAELADAYGSGPYVSNDMQVQVLLPAPSRNNTNPDDKAEFVLFFVRDYFGLIVK